MSLNYYLNIKQFNNDMQRFADIHGDCLEAEDITELAGEFFKLTGVRTIKAVNSCDSPDSAFDFIDILGEEVESEARREAPTLEGVTKEVFNLLCFGLYSHERDWFEDWETLEEDIINYLPNNEVKNWEPLGEGGDSESKLYLLLSVLASRFEALLWSDLQEQRLEFIDKIRIIKEFRDEFEPNISDSEGFGSDWFAFRGLLESDTYGELLEGVADWINSLVLVDYDTNGDPIESDTVPKDYLYLLGGKVAKASTFGGCY